ncbi:LRR receptor-like serine/threonine-protein kinase [Pyrus ussuriensis x Pyrus communis]|uniref:LRR receptor-like serine/threonine-protein kinase n=1 Tax=Pyrus ussuriensis x Pyrus communis TaxID=2448454 RepID=A0A5N5I694_9ROSA|nr:LRR receptor-like serine/threonine-protein kinase [Pyrus ussuriensis x Pyrus communis]
MAALTHLLTRWPLLGAAYSPCRHDCIEKKDGQFGAEGRGNITTITIFHGEKPQSQPAIKPKNNGKTRTPSISLVPLVFANSRRGETADLIKSGTTTTLLHSAQDTKAQGISLHSGYSHGSLSSPTRHTTPNLGFLTIYSALVSNLHRHKEHNLSLHAQIVLVITEVRRNALLGQ